RQNVAGLFLGRGVKFLAKRHDVDAARSERGTNWRCGVRLPRRNLQFDLSYDFFRHNKCLLDRINTIRWMSSKNVISILFGLNLINFVNPVSFHPRSTCQYSSSTGVARPKIVTETRSLPRSGSISSTMPVWFWNGPSATFTDSPTSKLTFGFTFSSRSFICASIDSTSDCRIGIGL